MNIIINKVYNIIVFFLIIIIIIGFKYMFIFNKINIQTFIILLLLIIL